SQLDPVILARVLREGFTAIAKQELANDPVLGIPLRLAGATFVDRKDGDRARSALAPVVETLQEGTSVIIEPEGTRSLTPMIGPLRGGPGGRGRAGGALWDPRGGGHPVGVPDDRAGPEGRLSHRPAGPGGGWSG